MAPPPVDDSVSYTLFPSLYLPRGAEGAFRISVSCEADFVLRNLADPDATA
jgi:hypothetical protein